MPIQSWMALVLFAGALGLYAALGVAPVRRSRALRQTAKALGLDYRDAHPELAASLQGALPMFSHGAAECRQVLTGRTPDAEYALFEYSFRRTRFGYPERKTDGVVACFRRHDGKYDTQIIAGGDRPTALWHVEADGPWLAMRPLRRRPKALGPKELAVVHQEVLDVYRTVVED